MLDSTATSPANTDLIIRPGVFSPGRRRISTIEVKVITGTPSWLVTVVAVRKLPISGFERDGVLSTIRPVTVSRSPG